MRDSLVSSSVWKPDFKRNLEKFPDLALIHLDFAVPYCDACNLGGRMSTLLGHLTGSPYDTVGFGSVGFAISHRDHHSDCPIISPIPMPKKSLSPLRKNTTWVVSVQGGPEFTMSSPIGKSVSFFFDFK
jgi:hypothetical protein